MTVTIEKPELDYKAGAKKIVDVFKTAIAPPLKEMLAKDTNVLSNADRIRAMSDEELAASNYIPCPYADDCCGECKYGWHEQAQTCEECKLEWLKQPVEGK